MTPARVVAIAYALVACSGADHSSLLDPNDASVLPLADATPPSDDGTAPDDAAPPDLDAGPPKKDAAPPKDAGNPYVDPGIACGTTECSPTTDLCCTTITSYYPQYTYAHACEPLSDLVQCAAGIPIYCDSDHDCPNNGICCGDLGPQTYSRVSCKTTCTGVVFGAQQIHFCDPKAPDCATNQTCKASTVIAGYYVCQ